MTSPPTLLFFLVCCLGQIGYVHSYEGITNVDDNASVYVELLGSLKIYSEKWHFFTHINLTEWENSVIQLQCTTDALHNFCNDLPKQDLAVSAYDNHDGCVAVTNNLKKISYEITKKIRYLYGIHQRSTNKLSDFYFEYINNIRKTNNLDDNVKFIQSDVNGIEQYLLNYKEKVQQQIRKMTSILSSGANLYQKSSRMKALTQDVISCCTLLAIHIENVIDFKFENLLLPSNLENELRNVEQILHSRNLELPLHVDSNTLPEFYKLATVSTFIRNKQLIISYNLPLLLPHTFNLYHLTVYPQLVTDFYYKLFIPDSRFIALADHSDKYIHLEDDYMQKCIFSSSYPLICQLTQPITSTHNTRSCSTAALTETYIPAYCNYRVAKITNEVWVQLYQPNAWLYVFPKMRKVTVACNGKRKEETFVVGIGKLRLDPHCIASTQYDELISAEELDSVTVTTVDVMSQMSASINWTRIVDYFNDESNSLTLEIFGSKFISINNQGKWEEYSYPIETYNDKKKVIESLE